MASDTGKPAHVLKASASPVSAASGQIGSTGLRRNRGQSQIFEEFLPTALTLRQRTDLYHQVASNSPLVGASLHLIRTYMAKAPVVVAARGDKPRHVAAAKRVEDMLSGSLVHDLLDDASTMLIYGFSLNEIVFRQSAATREWEVARLPPRSPRSVEDWIWDDETDECIGFVQRAWATGVEKRVPLAKCLHFRVGRGDADNPDGVALLRHALSSEYFARRLVELEAIGVERDLTGLPLIRVPGEMLDPAASAEQKAALETFRTLLRDIRRDKTEGIVIPSDRDETGNLYFDVELLSVAGNRQVQVSQGIERHEKRISQSFLTGFLFLGLGSGGTGSYALSDSTVGLFKASLAILLQGVADQINDKLLKLLWMANGWPDDTRPSVSFGPLDAVDPATLAQTIERLARAGFTLDDAKTQSAAREAAGLPQPPRTDDEAKRPLAAAPVTPSAGAQGPAAAQDPDDPVDDDDVAKTAEIIDLDPLIALLRGA